MQRHTLIIDDHLYGELQKMRAGLHEDGIDLSLTSAVNVVLLGGLIATDKFADEDWELIRDYLQNRAPTLEPDAFAEAGADEYLDNLRRLDLRAN